MPTFILICTDKPNAVEVRLANREAHLAYLKTFGDKVLMAGPMTDDAGVMAGSVIFFEGQDAGEAKAFAAGDPYAKAGLFAEVAIRPFRVAVGKLG